MIDGDRKNVFGLVSVALDEPYQINIWKGITQRASEMGIGIVGFIGSPLEKGDHPVHGKNLAYSFANPKNIDGLIIMTSALGCCRDDEDVKKMFDSGVSFPLVSIGIPVPGASNVWLRPDQEIDLLVDHLVDIHRRRKFVLVTGPVEHEESIMRKTAYLRALARHGIVVGEERVYPGWFDSESGSRAVKKLLADDIDFDAIICINDGMALGAIAELQNNGIYVPRDVSIVGFDGIEDGIYSTPPLTTIRQPLAKLGRTALDEALRRSVQGGIRDITLPCELIIRESCGCRENYEPPRAAPAELISGLPPEDRITVERLIECLLDGENVEFLEIFNEIIHGRIGIGMDITAWNEYLLYIRSFALSKADNVEQAEAYEMQILCALDTLGRINGRVLESRRLLHEKRAEIMRMIGLSFSEVFEFQLLLNRLNEGIRMLGFEYAWLVVFDSPLDASTWRQYQLGTPLSQELGPPSPSSATFPELPQGRAFFKDGAWILLPLVFQCAPLGYLLLPGEEDDCTVYGMLGKLLSSSIKGALLWDEVRRHEKTLESEVKERTSELLKANAKLKKEIVQRIKLEQEVVDTSNHTMERIGRDLHDDMCQFLAGIAMRVSALQQSLLEDRPEEVGTLQTINDLLADSMDRIKAIVKGLVPQILAERGLAAALEDMAASLRRSHRKTSVAFSSSGTLNYLDNARAVQLYRIVQEALSNSLKHSGCTKIEIVFSVQDERRPSGARQRLSIEVRDNGKGLKPSSVSRGMGHKIMRYRALKAGAKLNIRNADPGTIVACSLEIRGGKNS